MRIFIITLTLFITTLKFVVAQTPITDLEKTEDTLIYLLEKARGQSDEDSKILSNKSFKEHLIYLLTRNSKSFEFPFKKLSKQMSTLKSPDGEFRIFNWNLELNKYGEHKYFCIVVKYDKKKDNYYIIDCKDKSKYARTPEYTQFTEKKWYGALYYKIIPVKKGSKTIYTLLGWDGNDISSNKKLIETMKFSGNSKLKFGDPLFKFDDGKIKRRVIFQYKKDTYMSIKYQKIKKVDHIIFDHLSPTSPELEGIKDWYVTDLSFDALIWEKGKWNYIKDIDARTGKKFKTKYNNPENK
jgi:hypothetical protein